MCLMPTHGMGRRRKYTVQLMFAARQPTLTLTLTLTLTQNCTLTALTKHPPPPPSRFSQGAASSSVEPDQDGSPETLSMGHLETAVRILAMLARAEGGCSTFEERLDVLLQAYYFLGRMAKTVAETVAWGRRRRLYEEAVPEGAGRNSTPFEEWWEASGEKGTASRALA